MQGNQKSNNHQREATLQDKARMTYAPAQGPLQTVKTLHDPKPQNFSSIQVSHLMHQTSLHVASRLIERQSLKSFL